jgi:hypothetical protein
VALFRRILSEPDFLRSEIHTTWLDELLRRPRAPESETAAAFDAAAIAAAMWRTTQESKAAVAASDDKASRWKSASRREQVDRRP